MLAHFIQLPKQRLFYCVLLFLFLFGNLLTAQESEVKRISLDELVSMGLHNHHDAVNASLYASRYEAERMTIFDPGDTRVTFGNGQIHSVIKDEYLLIEQEFGSLLTPFARAHYVKKLIANGKNEEAIKLCKLEGDIKSAWFNWLYSINYMLLMQEKTEQASDFMRVTRARYETGEDNLLERTVAETQYAELKTRFSQAQQEVIRTENTIRMYAGMQEDLLPENASLELYAIRASSDSTNRYPGTLVMSYWANQYDLAISKWRVEQSRFFPEINAGYFRQKIDGTAGFEGWQAGITFPLWFLPQTTAVRQARIDKEIAKNDLEFQKQNLQITIDNLLAELQKLFEEISYYNSSGLIQADLILKTAALQYEKEDIGYMEYMQAVQTALTIRETYLNILNRYNQLAVKLEFYTW